MASNKLSIHVVPEANPENILALVHELDGTGLTFDTFGELLDYLSERGIGTARTELTRTAVDMGILTDSNGIQLAEYGEILEQVREEARGELLHYLFYAGWQEEKPTEFLQSWAYRLCCNQYWEQGKTELKSDYLNRQVSEVINIATQTFSDFGVDDFDEIAFSRKSLTGVNKWLSGLNPAVIDGNTLAVRTFCQPELMLLAISYVLKDETDVIDIDVLLTPEKREEICKLCMIENEALDRSLDWAIPIYRDVIEPGTTAGFYGRFIRLKKKPELRDVIR